MEQTMEAFDLDAVNKAIKPRQRRPAKAAKRDQ